MISRSKILIASYHYAKAELAKNYLEKFGFASVTAALDSKRALEEVINVAETSDRYDLIICDYKMPHCSGLDILSELRFEEEIEYTKFLMLVPNGHQDAIDESLKQGADAYLAVPYSEIALIEKVGELLKEPMENIGHNPFSNREVIRKVNG